MAVAGAAARRALDAALGMCRVGATTGVVAWAARKSIEASGGTALFEGYPAEADVPFPDVACVCVNDEVVHGVPGDRVIAAGDLVTVDVGVVIDGWCGDVADSIVVGPRDSGERGAEAELLIDATRAVVAAVVGRVGPGVWWSSALEAGVAAAEGYAFVPGYVGHAIGRELHERLRVPFVTGQGGRIEPQGRHDFRLWPGMCFTIEPILASPGACRDGRHTVPETVIDDDGWTVRLAAGGLAAQVEEVVAVTAEGCRVLTARQNPGSLGAHAGESRPSKAMDNGL